MNLKIMEVEIVQELPDEESSQEERDSLDEKFDVKLSLTPSEAR